jgi:protein phosphatase 1D
VIFVRGNKLYIGHVGDSSIVLGEGESLYKCWRANRITRDHKPEDPSELKRIRESGGNVLCKAGVHRVVWNRQKFLSSSTSNRTTIEYEQIPFLAVSRALGDLWSLNNQTNLYSVSPEPELTVIEIDPNRHRCLILASDGLWNMITPEVAVEIVRNCDVKTEEMILKSEVNKSLKDNIRQ